MTATNCKDIVILCENLLGLTHPQFNSRGEPIPLYKSRATEAGKLKRKIQEKPKLYTFENLETTIKYLHEKRQPIKSPAALCWLVEEALEFTNQDKPKLDITERVEAALAKVKADPSFPDRDLWIRRLSRAQGAARDEVVDEFEAVKR